ncbi:gp53-like domain-containing protein [Paenibacillus graminis]|uniref:hyaluronate lyase N-terminal domain-containing protein n=1 Tax=Paenibacillus graminis TaxID=189425 RepID=UPI002DB9F43E|nr:hypothetical protein [Paenibacillus graminis]MEC0167850.1 hypothetical protein [Paenibacillus graminis]
MANKIQLRRGTKAQLATLGVLAQGEPGYCTDTNELFIGNGTGSNTQVITGDAIVAATPNTIIKRDASGRAQVAAPAAAGDIARKADVDNVASAAAAAQTTANAALSRAGGTMSGEINFSDDGEGVSFNGGGRIYKKSGAGLVLRRHAGDTNPEVESYDGSNRWEIWHYGMTATLMPISKGDNGYTQMPNGLLIAWGTAVLGVSATSNIIFPVAFATGCTPQVVLTPMGDLSAKVLDTISRTGFSVQNTSASLLRVRWMAIGWWI